MSESSSQSNVEDIYTDIESNISIIIVNYNAGNLLLECVESIFSCNYKNFEIIVVDNASKDNSHKKCKEVFSKIRLIENNENLGYCEANNIGIRNAKGSYIVILNPDTTVDPNWLNELILSYKKYGEGLYQPKILTIDNHKVLLNAGNMIQTFGFGFARGRGKPDTSQYDQHELIGYASGTCLFTSTELLRRLGMLDSFLFAYHDDLDLGWRAAIQDIKSHYVPKSIIYHPSEGFSFKWNSYKFYLLERNRQYCILTHYSKSTFYKLLPYLFLVDIMVWSFYLKKGMLKSKIRASLDLIKNKKIIQQKYLEIQKHRKLSDKEIMHNFQDEMDIPKGISDDFSNKLFNKFIKILSKSAKTFI